MSYWPWWAGAAALATIGFVYYRLTGMRLGVSGLMARVAAWRAERQKDRTAASWKADPTALEAALQAATRKAFGDKAVADTPVPATPPAPASRVPVVAGLLFMVMLVVGGLVGSLVRGGWNARTTLGPTWESFFGSGVTSWLILIGGGILVGIGTRTAGGCTSGHGLSGCSRLQSASLLATMAFFGTAVAVSFLLASLARMS